MRKTFLKKLTAIMLVAMMAVGMLGVASAGVSVTIDDDDTTHSYQAYQVFKGTYDATNDVLTEIEWSESVKSAEIVAALDTDEVLGEYFTSDMSAKQVAKALSQFSSDSEEAKAFAQIVGANLNFSVGTSQNNVLWLEPGYYLIVDSSTDANAVISSFILKVVGNSNIEVDVKKSLPTLEKTVEGTTVYDAAVGDIVDYKLTGTVADNYSDFSTYKFVFSDTMSNGLTYVDGDDADTNVDVVVKVDGNEINDGYTVVQTGQSFTVTFDNLKTIEAVTDSSVITVEYQATVNSSANIGSTGNVNTAKLEYSNNPNVGSEGTTGTTPEEKTTVYVYGLEVDKKDSDGTSPLAGVEFQLKNAGGKFASVSEGKIVDWLDTADATCTLTTDANGKINISGLDAATYTLVETQPLPGYNPIDPMEFTITAELNEETQTITSIALDGEAGDAATGIVGIEVINEQGSELPSTGGMGTTILYIVGGILVVGAGITLVVRKRMQNEAE